jgi:hypothetical protein
MVTLKAKEKTNIDVSGQSSNYWKEDNSYTPG